MGWASQLFSYLPLLLAVYSAWTSGGYTPLLQFALTIFVGRLLSTALSSQLQLMFMAKMSLWVLFQVSLVPGAIVLGAYFSGCSMQMLSSCLFTAFLFPAARRKYPKGGPMAIAAFIVASVSYAWQAFGISPYLVFLVFMQALPELQRALWIGGPTRTRAHVALVATVCLLASPFAAMGGVALYEPQLLTRLSDGQLRALCYASNGCPSIDHRDLYAALGLSKYASPHEVRKAYRKISLENHPDKLVQLEPTLEPEEREARVDAFTRAAGAYELLSKPGAQGQYDAMMRDARGVRPELLDLAPRCVAVAIMLVYWLALSASNLRDAKGQKTQVAERLRRHILHKGPLNLPALGLSSREPIEDFARFHELPTVLKNDEDELMEFRRLLKEAGNVLLPIDPTAEMTIIRSTRGDAEGLRAHVLNGGAMCCDALGIERKALEKYARDPTHELIPIAGNDRDDVLKMRALLEAAGLLLGPMPEGVCMLVEIKP